MATNVKVPYITKVLLENDRVKVYEFYSRPGETTEMHWHPDFVAYPLTSGTMKLTLKDGRSQEKEFRTGEPFFGSEQWHVAENIGNSEIRLLVIDISKQPASETDCC